MIRRRVRLRGKRRKALALRRLSQDAGPRELARLGLPVDADLLYRSLPYAIEPEWTRGHNFRIGYELLGEGGGTGPSRSRTAAPAASAAWMTSPSRWCGFATRTG